MRLTPEIDRALDTVRAQICPRCPWRSQCTARDREPGRQSRCTIFRHLPNVTRIACSRDPMLSFPAEAVAREIAERHENTPRDGAIPDTLFRFRDEVVRILTPVVQRKMHERVFRWRQNPAGLLVEVDERGRQDELAPECFLG